jgi:hypothetical protein
LHGASSLSALLGKLRRTAPSAAEIRRSRRCHPSRQIVHGVPTH